MRYTFDELVRLAEQEAGGSDTPTRPSVLKELIHYDILLALSRSAMADTLVFQGGTALRLCYGGQRYSEDLDFVCGTDAREPFVLDEVADLLRTHVADRYGLTVGFKQPGEGKGFFDESVTVKRWAITLQVPGFAAAQRIHFEVCNVPAYQPRPMLVQPRYGFLSDVYNDIALRCESREEIYADKLVALVGRRHLKARDLWDLRWLDERGVRPDYGLVMQKIADYGITDLVERIQATRDRLESKDAERTFVQEMTRFVTPSLARMLAAKGSAEPWLDQAKRELDKVEKHVRAGLGAKP